MEYRRSHDPRANIKTKTSSWRVFFILLLAVVAIAQPDLDFIHDVTSPDGPLHSDGFCSNGTMQSPININVPLSPVNYSLPVSPDTKYVTANASLSNNGFSPQLVGPFGNFTIGNKTYDFVNLHFHRPAEHTLNIITRYQLEMHIVHMNADGERAVIALFFTLGASSPFLSQFFHLLPQIEEIGDPPVLVPNLEPSFSMSGKYARYLGSLTLPPCTEGVIWTVMLQPNTLSTQQLAQFISSFPDESARSVQPGNGRVVQISPSEWTQF
ncbi:hypothetical protein MPTK1_8g15470 [Marchantia polymorpha subsp. ruderalis]|uniref:Alpha-carbonic anhydrase domain-containing protein n=1 Tax=Marchantia polymorpha TaxID=3197 RepID=A0A2R6WL24_MARPO|nr:hypothetical protein MARPO_0079s0066 [Marchantia polymorpha]PTQ34565.1 hypothetical protein MARPO_0079s0066 [Marchantia polymorpha]BBN19988.1 hypothetical protein Mp_8g15470 [Marchantia polymorpha subsp. ruderalis]BBN19989.1 hypothetical protein Mp_8g15470 [Marchantia polymorpha subsp. ruderalis]|eukprot:PTQ34564.1 hypothetical protein MARPO_0079s0066 [Marchantia polymorpha]